MDNDVTAILLCILCWAAIVAGPIVIAIILNGQQQKRAFHKAIEAVGGVVVAENQDKSIIVRIPFQEFSISGAYFPTSSHWFGKDVIELHIALPENESQLYYCCRCTAGSRTPPGWHNIPFGGRT